MSSRLPPSARTLVAVLAIGCSSSTGSVNGHKDGGAGDSAAGPSNMGGGSSSGGATANQSTGGSGGMNASGASASSGASGGVPASGGSSSAGRGGTGGGAMSSGGTSSSSGGASASDSGASDAGNPNLCGSIPCTATRCAGTGCGPAVCCEGPNGPVCIHGATECPAADGGVRTEKLQCIGGAHSAEFARSCSRDSECFVAQHWAGCCHVDAVGLNVTEQTAFMSFETSCGGPPACGCCCDRVFTESGMTVTSGTALSVRCVDGMCTTSSP